MFGGQVAKNVSFFVETDAPISARRFPAARIIQPSLILQDAYAELRVADAFMVNAGLMFIPFSRNSLQARRHCCQSTTAPTRSTTASRRSPPPAATPASRREGIWRKNDLAYRVGASGLS